MKNCMDVLIFHRAICVENTTNKPLSDKVNCLLRFLLRFFEQDVLGMENFMAKEATLQVRMDATEMFGGM